MKKKTKKCKDGEHKCKDTYEVCSRCNLSEGDCEKCGTYCDSDGNEI